MNDQERAAVVDEFLSATDPAKRARAAQWLNADDAEIFPVYDPDAERWILSVEVNFNAESEPFVSGLVQVFDGSECPKCGNDRHEFRTFDNGYVGGFVDECTICEHIHDRDMG